MNVSLTPSRTLFVAGAVALALAGCDNGLPGSSARAATPPAAVAQAAAPAAQPTMQTGTEAIKACMANGLSETTCAQVYHDMMAGRPPQGASSFAECEAKYGVGKCGNNPVPTANGTGSVFLPLAAGAALGALGGYLLSKNLAPKGAYVPPTDWLKNRPSVSAPHNPVMGASNSAVAVGGAKSTPVAPAAGSSFKQATPTSRYATAQRNGGYTYKSTPSTRPGSRNFGRRR